MKSPLSTALSCLQMAEDAAKTLVDGRSTAGADVIRSTVTGVVEALLDARVALIEAIQEREALVKQIGAFSKDSDARVAAPR
jgi:hypothetical protein